MQNTEKELKDYFNEQIKIIKNIVKTEKSVAFTQCKSILECLKVLILPGIGKNDFERLLRFQKEDTHCRDVLLCMAKN